MACGLFSALGWGWAAEVGADRVVLSREMLLEVFDSLVDWQAGIIGHTYRTAMGAIETQSYAAWCRSTKYLAV